MVDEAAANPPESDKVETVKLPETNAWSFERISEDGERFVPHQFRDKLYRVADPALGGTKHHAANQIPIRDDEIALYIERGFYLRMRGEIRRHVSLISPKEIVRVRQKNNNN